MIKDANGNILDYRNRKERRFANIRQRHKIYTKKYPNKRSYLRSVEYIREQTASDTDTDTE